MDLSKLNLTQEQAEHLYSVKWLLSGPRGCGKSYVVATALVLHAVATGEPVVLRDFPTHSRGNSHYFRDLVSQIADHLGLTPTYNIRNNTMQIRL